MKKTLWTVVCALIIGSTFTACMNSRATLCSSFQKKAVESPNAADYVVLKNGTKLLGSQEWKSPKVGNITVTINGTTYKRSELKAYMHNSSYYERIPGLDVLCRRIVQGKVNIYIYPHSVSGVDTRSTGPSSSVTSNYNGGSCWYYLQNGEGQPFTLVKKLNQYAQAVESCPTAFQMLDMKEMQLIKTIRSNPSYLNDAFDIYNNGCQKLKK